ncbi:M20 family metallopeptidase (plasmid) [Roseomonas gilardii subsp. gilardii]|uniref:M20 aminoacylase family protein n=1 Tax=Roseomonas gilardii TaxID=257708 RepID=UPI001FF8BD50|nr:M20 aminoacylase family protein [Roseomonas gilardii]UPG74556.1 M20 family metallopeptidase [Roseomonas gilardii subsp. gilardii]
MRDEAFWAGLREWRRDFHAHPEFGFEEHRTSRLVAERLRSFGFTEVAEGVGGTGVVATLTRGGGNRSIALRADMDALRIPEQGSRPHRSRVPGVMHACGHDGHTTMLLGAARVLAAEGGFDGTVRFIFQPAEEWGKGALAMLDDGLVERFPFEEIYGLHNMPGLPVGEFRTRAGPVMSAEDNFEIVLRGLGGHASRPQGGREVLVAACALVMNLQTIVSRRVAPTDTAVVSVTELLTDGTRNALPGKARILGDARSFRPEVSAMIETEMRRIAAGTAAGYDLVCDVTYTREFVPTINDPAATAAALAAARTVLGAGNVGEAEEPHTGSEDFARLLRHAPGCFAFIGNGESSKPLHNPEFDFNDDALPHGTNFFVQIVRDRLPLRDSQS